MLHVFLVGQGQRRERGRGGRRGGTWERGLMLVVLLDLGEFIHRRCRNWYSFFFFFLPFESCEQSSHWLYAEYTLHHSHLTLFVILYQLIYQTLHFNWEKKNIIISYCHSYQLSSSFNSFFSVALETLKVLSKIKLCHFPYISPHDKQSCWCVSLSTYIECLCYLYQTRDRLVRMRNNLPYLSFFSSPLACYSSCWV